MSTSELLLGKYRLLERLGEGGMGIVFRARDGLLDRDVAIKQLRAELAPEGALTERFRAEAVMLARLSHPCIAALHGLERQGDRLYMVMEYLPGETLESLVARDGPVPWRRAVEICRAVLDALEHAHERGIVHRDIKPANVMVLPDGGVGRAAERGAGKDAARVAVKVMDFGIARVMGGTRHTRQGHAVGTPAYMAPEQLRGEEVDGRADLYALGAVLYELLAGRVAFEADSDYRLMMMQLHDAPPAPGAAVPGLPPALDRIVARAMAKRPVDRFASAAAMRVALDGVVAGEGDRTSASPWRLASSAPFRSAGEVVAEVRAAVRMSVSRALPASHRAALASWAADWRGWATVACLAAAAMLSVRALRPPLAAAPEGQSALVDAGGQGATGALDTATGLMPGAGPRPGEPPAVMASRTDDLPPAWTAYPSPELPPVAMADTSGLRKQGGAAPPPEAAARPTTPTAAGRRRGATSGGPTPGGTTGGTTPPAAPATGAAEREEGARAAATSFIRLIAGGDAAAAGRALGGGGSSDDLLTLMRDRRLVGAEALDLSVTADGGRGEATAQLAVAWRTAFGGNRRSTVRIQMALVRDGSTWRVGSARVVSGALR